ncbi:MAG TPA: hypothetical protein VIN38_11550 [Thiobacillus sp.]
MIDDLVGFAVAAATDLTIEKAARRCRWVRILKAMGGLLFTALIIGLIYVTARYT